MAKNCTNIKLQDFAYTTRKDTHNCVDTGPVGQQGPHSQFIARMPSAYRRTLKFRACTFFKVANYDTAGYENPKPHFGNRERIPPHAEIWG